MPTWPNGIGEALGDSLVTGSPLTLNSSVIHVHYGTGDDTHGGLSRESPKKTLGAAISASSDNGWIVLLDGHEESGIDSLQPSAQGLVIVGAGRDAQGRPTAKLTVGSPSGPQHGLALVLGGQLRNVWMTSPSGANSGGVVYFVDPGIRVEGCYFECGANLDTGAITAAAGATGAVIRDCTFVSTATSFATRPHSAIYLTDSQSDWTIDGCVFDGGGSGFQNPAIYCTAAMVRLRAERISLLNGADVNLHQSTGYFMPTTTDGNSRILWSNAGGA